MGATDQLRESISKLYSELAALDAIVASLQAEEHLKERHGSWSVGPTAGETLDEHDDTILIYPTADGGPPFYGINSAKAGDKIYRHKKDAIRRARKLGLLPPSLRASKKRGKSPEFRRFKKTPVRQCAAKGGETP